MSFSSLSEAQAFLDGYQAPVRVDLDQCTGPDLVIFTDGSYTPSGSKPASAGWGFVVQPGDEETAIHEGSGPLFTPVEVRHEGQLKPTNNTAELQAIHMSLQWCLDNPVHVHKDSRIIICPDSSFAISRVSTKGKLKSHASYATHLRELLQAVKDRYPSVGVEFHKVEGHSARDDREARGNNRVDSLAKVGAESYISVPLPRPRLPPSVVRRSVRPPPAASGRDRHRPHTDTRPPPPPPPPDVRGPPCPLGASQLPAGIIS